MHSIKTTLKKRQTLTPVSLLLKPNISIWQLLICSPSSSPPPPPSSSSPSPTHIFSPHCPCSVSDRFFSPRSLFPPRRKGWKEAVCVFSLKFLSQNYNTLKGKLTVMKKQCRVTGVSSPSLHGPLRQRCSSRRRICSPEGNTTTNCSPKTPHSVSHTHTHTRYHTPL